MRISVREKERYVKKNNRFKLGLRIKIESK